MSDWKELVDKVKNLQHKTRIALVGKYVELQDAYISVVEALKHAGYVYDSTSKSIGSTQKKLQKTMFEIF